MKRITRKLTVIDTMCDAEISVELSNPDVRGSVETKGKTTLGWKCNLCPAQRFCPKLNTLKGIAAPEFSVDEKVNMILNLISPENESLDKKLDITSCESERETNY